MKRAAVFFDRDNTLIANDGYLGDPNGVVLIDGAADAIARARELGYAVVVFSNQSGVARGKFTEEAVHAVNHRLDEMLLDENAHAVIDRHEFCPFHPEAEVERYRQDSDLRKPKPGMIFQAERQLALDLSRSWVIGDAPRDIDAGHAAGCRTVLVKNGSLPESPAAREPGEHAADFEVESLREGLEVIARSRAAETATVEEPAPPPVAVLAPEPEPEPVVEHQPVAEPEPAPEVHAPETAEPERKPESESFEGSVESNYPVEEKPVEESVEVSRTIVDEQAPAETPVESAPADAVTETVAEEPPARTEPARPWLAAAASVAAERAGTTVSAEPKEESTSPVTVATDTEKEAEPASPVATPQRGKARSEILLGQILDEIRRRNEQPADDFSVSKLVAGIVQVLALAALFLGYIQVNKGQNPTAVLWLLAANFLQAFTIALLIMGRQK